MIMLHGLARPIFERVMSRNGEREHFFQRHAGSSPGNLLEPMDEGTGVDGGWKAGDASPKGSGPAHPPQPTAA
jgi:hypothetical protein